MVKQQDGTEIRIECDSVVNGIGFVPAPIAADDHKVYRVGTCEKWGNLPQRHLGRLGRLYAHLRIRKKESPQGLSFCSMPIPADPCRSRQRQCHAHGVDAHARVEGLGEPFLFSSVLPVSVVPLL